MKCPKCASPMKLKRQITFPSGPARLVWECDRDRNHVKIEEAPTDQSAP